MQVTITINGEQVTREVEPRKLLVHFVREDAGLRGTHWGCDTSNCGTCTLWVDGTPVKSCTMLAAQADGHEVTTVEGLEKDGELSKDELERAEKELDKLIHAHEAQIDVALAAKETELLED